MMETEEDIIVGGQWIVESKIGEGCFGEVFKVRDKESSQYYALKREPMESHYPQLRHEYMMYRTLAGGPCIPQCHWFGQKDQYNCLVIDLLGTSLKQFQQTVHKVSMEMAVALGCQMISCLEFIHDQGIIYRDIKPDNFLFSQPGHLSIVDFGLACWWRHPKTHRVFNESKKPIQWKTGTARYASLNVHRGHTPSRRDDMESLGYVLLDLILSDLPWSGITARNPRSGWDRLRSMKEEIQLDQLCVPQGLVGFIEYTRKLRFYDRPDYDYLKKLLIGCVWNY
ncbi:kinase-like domain-containing protein [Pilobolus umbonatus]|nr:kinase-like domain-containing protein [Pilobolus umbonatus]